MYLIAIGLAWVVAVEVKVKFIELIQNPLSVSASHLYEL